MPRSPYDIVPTPPWAILPLPGDTYDAEYMMNVVRIMNYFMQQTTVPSILSGAILQLYNNRPYKSSGVANPPNKQPTVLFNTQDNDLTLSAIMHFLPTGTAAAPPVGLVPDQIWIDTTDGPGKGILRINN